MDGDKQTDKLAIIRNHVPSIIFCGHSFASMYTVSVKVRDKSIGLGGTVYIWDLICVLYVPYNKFNKLIINFNNNNNNNNNK